MTICCKVSAGAKIRKFRHFPSSSLPLLGVPTRHTLPTTPGVHRTQTGLLRDQPRPLCPDTLFRQFPALLITCHSMIRVHDGSKDEHVCPILDRNHSGKPSRRKGQAVEVFKLHRCQVFHPSHNMNPSAMRWRIWEIWVMLLVEQLFLRDDTQRHDPNFRLQERHYVETPKLLSSGLWLPEKCFHIEP